MDAYTAQAPKRRCRRIYREMAKRRARSGAVYRKENPEWQDLEVKSGAEANEIDARGMRPEAEPTGMVMAPDRSGQRWLA